MSKKQILIYDDVEQRANGFKDKLGEGLGKANQSDDFNVVSLEHGKFLNAIKALEQRRIEFREREIDLENIPKDEAEEIDNASIFMIDYDLLDSQENESKKDEMKLFTGFLTGEIVAYLVRCFSRCKLIIGLNQYGSNPFDLTLRGDLGSFADLNLGEKQLDNPGLWKSNWEDSEQEFRPWSWPNLCDLLHDFEKKVEDVQDNLEKSIGKFLKFDKELFQVLPREIVQFIEKQEKKEHYQTTFWEFLTESGNGLRLKDTEKLKKGMNVHILARVGAARISKWLEQLVLPEQDILVDAPHLVARYPSLIEGDKEEIGTWNSIAQLVKPDKLGLKTELIEPYKFDKEHWVSRPVWFWDKLRECERIREIIEPWLTVKPGWVFCEDTSYFEYRENCEEFLAETASPFTRRFVKKVDDVDYRPRVRFSM